MKKSALVNHLSVSLGFLCFFEITVMQRKKCVFNKLFLLSNNNLFQIIIVIIILKV